MAEFARLFGRSETDTRIAVTSRPPDRDQMPDTTHFATSLKRGLLGLAAASLLALAGYALLAKSAEEPSRAGQPPPGARSMPVLAAAAHECVYPVF